MAESSLKRVFPKEEPFPRYAAAQKATPWMPVPEWPARWLPMPVESGFCLYRLQLRLEESLTTRIHVTADERYELYINGAFQARGSERGDIANWYYESYELTLSPGRHTIIARVWALSADRPWAQESLAGGFLLAAEGDAQELLSTGTAKWDVIEQGGIRWEAGGNQPAGIATGGGPGFIFECGKLDPDWRKSDSGVWDRAAIGEMPAVASSSVFIQPNRHYLRPGFLRPQISEISASAALRFASKEDLFANALKPVDQKANDKTLQFALAPVLQGKSYTVPPRTTIRAVIDLGSYACHYPAISFAGGKGATMRLRYAESLWDKVDEHGTQTRDAIDGKIFKGFFDRIIADGGSHRIQIPWWRAGRFVQLEIKTTREPLELKRIAFELTHYDLGAEFRLESNIPGLNEVAAAAVRTLQMCSHETHVDCPYYEQLQYVGDTRLQALLAFLVSPDSRLAKKAMLLFEASRANRSGLTTDAHPGAGKLIAPYSLFWVAMIADYARWRGDAALVRELLPGARDVVARFTNLVDGKGLLVSPRGWNYVDVAERFEHGVPPGGQQGGHSAVLHWQLIYTLVLLAEVEDQFGIPAFADQWRLAAENLVAAAEEHYWDAKRQLFADDVEHKTFSQHTQALAVLSRQFKRTRCQQMMNRTVREKDLTPCNIYFSHYLFEASAMYDGGEYIRQRLSDWTRLLEQGYTTFPEHFGPTRSECHAWGAHVLYHILTTIVGLRPEGWSAEAILLEPRLQEGEWVKVAAAHPKGMMHFELVMSKEGLVGKGVVPRGVKISGGNRDVVIRQV